MPSPESPPRNQFDAYAPAEIAILVERVGVGPLRCRGEDPAAIPVDPVEPMVLHGSALVLLPIPPPQGGGPVAEGLALSFTTRHHATTLSASCWTATGVHPVATLDGGPDRRWRDFLALPEPGPTTILRPPDTPGQPLVSEMFVYV